MNTTIETSFNNIGESVVVKVLNADHYSPITVIVKGKVFKNSIFINPKRDESFFIAKGTMHDTPSGSHISLDIELNSEPFEEMLEYNITLTDIDFEE